MSLREGGEGGGVWMVCRKCEMELRLLTNKDAVEDVTVRRRREVRSDEMLRFMSRCFDVDDEDDDDDDDGNDDGNDNDFNE